MSPCPCAALSPAAYLVDLVADECPLHGDARRGAVMLRVSPAARRAVSGLCRVSPTGHGDGHDRALDKPARTVL